MSRRTPEGPPPVPPVQRLRVRYAKRGRMRYTSSRDFQRALERAVRLAGLPMAYSGGFHPHPRISYANAAPTGAASEAEYVELLVTEVVDPQQVAGDLDRALPSGLDVVSVSVADAGALADRLQASRWSLRFASVRTEALRHAVDQLLARPAHQVTRMMKNGPRELDVRAALVDLSVSAHPGPDEPSGVVVTATIRHTTPTIRPEEVWSALRECGAAGLNRPVSTRIAQGMLDEQGLVSDPQSGVAERGPV